MINRSNPPKDGRNPRDFNDPRNKPQDRSERPERSEWASRKDRTEGGRPERGERPDWAARGDRSQRPERGDRPARGDRGGRPERGDRPDWAARGERPQRPDRAPRFDNGDRPRPPRGASLIAELRELDRDLIRMIAKRSRMLTRLPGSGTSEHERELRTSWEENAASVSRDPRLIRQIFALLQEVEVAPADMDQPSAFNLSPARKPLAVELPAPASDRLPRLNMVLAASSASEGTLYGVPLNNPVMECLKGLNQVGAHLRWEEDGRILCQGGEPVSGYNKPILDKVVHVGDDPFNLYLILFQMLTRPARLKIIGDSGLKFVDLAALRHFLPLLGARLTSVVPGQEGLPARLESSAMLPAEVTVPADIPGDAVEALLIATAGWEREVTVDLSSHPDGKIVLSRILPLLQRSGIKAEAVENGETLSLHVVPGKAVIGEITDAGVNLGAALTVLAMPAFVGGTVKLTSAWNATGDAQTFALLQSLLTELGMRVAVTDDLFTVSFADQLAGGEALPVVTPLTTLGRLNSSLFPLEFVLSILPAIRNKGGVLPTLPENADMVLIDSFLNQVGLAREEGQLVPTTPSTAPWASPTLQWALALSLAAFLRPNIKLSNPNIVLNYLPTYWNVYNSLPTPSLTRKVETEEAAPQENVRPARRRVLASHTPESEMPDEIVYPDED